MLAKYVVVFFALAAFVNAAPIVDYRPVEVRSPRPATNQPPPLGMGMPKKDPSQGMPPPSQGMSQPPPQGIGMMQPQPMSPPSQGTPSLMLGMGMPNKFPSQGTSQPPPLGMGMPKKPPERPKEGDIIGYS